MHGQDELIVESRFQTATCDPIFEVGVEPVNLIEHLPITIHVARMILKEACDIYNVMFRKEGAKCFNIGIQRPVTFGIIKIVGERAMFQLNRWRNVKVPLTNPDRSSNFRPKSPFRSNQKKILKDLIAKPTI